MATQFDLSALERLRAYLVGLRQQHLSTLTHYISEPRSGFWHQPEKKYKSSLSSTSTCVSSLVHANLWQHEKFLLKKRASVVARELIRKNRSADLPRNNPFSLAFVAEGVLDLRAADPAYDRSLQHLRRVAGPLAERLRRHLLSDRATAGGLKPRRGGPAEGRPKPRGSVAIDPYPPSAYLTQLVFRVLMRCERAAEAAGLIEQQAGGLAAWLNHVAVTATVHSWARAEINKQVALLTAKSKSGDALQLAYALILAVTTVPDERTSPEDKEIFSHALALFFECQAEDGSWPLSRPLFHYPEVGNAYCFDYELLAQLLECQQLWDDLLLYIPQLDKAARLLAKSAYDLDPAKPGTVVGWASGHHPQLEGPESWSTASVYQFAHALDRLVAEAVRRAIFQELGGIYRLPTPFQPGAEDKRVFAEDFLDARLNYKGNVLSLRDTLAKHFVKPIDQESLTVAKGGKLGRSTPMSAILFGPPGTSKTQLAEIISNHLGWPLVVVDPSYLVQEGLDRIQAMANKLFSMLAMGEQLVVLLDEFDEMGRDRSRSGDLLSRFITTAMLPKLADINKQRKIVFLLATNYVSGFDAAFRRGGRFDMLLQVMQPTYDAKLHKREWSEALSGAAAKIHEEKARQRLIQQIDDLTYLEAEQLVGYLKPELGEREIIDHVQAAWDDCTLNKVNDPRGAEADERLSSAGPLSGLLRRSAKKAKRWRDTCQEEAEQIRLPPTRL